MGRDNTQGAHQSVRAEGFGGQRGTGNLLVHPHICESQHTAQFRKNLAEVPSENHISFKFITSAKLLFLQK